MDRTLGSFVYLFQQLKLSDCSTGGDCSGQIHLGIPEHFLDSRRKEIGFISYHFVSLQHRLARSIVGLDSSYPVSGSLETEVK